MYAAFEYHVIQSKEGWLLIHKSQAGLHDAYVDIREWRAATWKEHPRLAQSLIDNGKGNLIIQSASNGLLDGVFQRSNKKRSAEKEENSVKL